MTQEEALQILKSGKSVFLTGIAGAGKTYVLSQYIEHLQEKETPFAVTASTGIVATALNGTTIHSFSGLGIRDTLNKNDLERLKFNKKVSGRIRSIQVLIIDEISMLSADQLDCINAIFKIIRNKDEDFGGVQVVFCGDFLQLPPVRGTFAFTSIIWQNMDLAICYLDKAYRQKDSDLLTILNAIRDNNVSDAMRKMIHNRIGAKVKNSIKLFTHNEDVDMYNQRELAKLKEKSFHYFMWATGDKTAAEFIKKSCLSPENLELKVGAKVMVTKNNFDEGIVNGTMAIVQELTNEAVLIKTLDGRSIRITPQKWSRLNEFGKIIASINQIPLRLAYAITVHKSQGMTLDAATMNLSKVFQRGQGYVALSRLRSLESLSLEEAVSEETFFVSPECLQYEKEIMKIC